MTELKYTIPEKKLEEFKLGFLKAEPIPLNRSGEPRMTENEWIREWGRLEFIQIYQRGKQMIATEQAMQIEEGLVE